MSNTDSLSLVRFDNNSYSVPTKYAYRQITVVATVDEVRLVFEDQLIACHSRHWGREQFLFDPVHYLALLERKPGGFDHARPLENWDLPVCFGILRRRLEAELNGMGTRECEKVASRCASDNVDHLGFLLQLCELELIDRERRAAERRLKAAKFSTHKTLCRAPATLGHEPHFNTAFRFSPAGRYVF